MSIELTREQEIELMRNAVQRARERSARQMRDPVLKRAVSEPAPGQVRSDYTVTEVRELAVA